MTILLIDDLRDFRVTPKENLIIARNSAEGMKALQTAHENREKFTSIWFDHDLGGDDTTMRIVDYMSEQGYNDTPVQVDQVYVHTSNRVGREQILRSLRNYGYPAVPVDANVYFHVQ